MTTSHNFLDLYDFRRRVAALYRQRNSALHSKEDPAAVAGRFRSERDRLFATHPQSALDVQQQASFQGLDYFPYDPEACVVALLDPNVAQHRLEVETSGEQAMSMSLAATAYFTLGGEPQTLSVYWIDVYGGGLFLPFRDLTAPDQTYGGGRYLFDTVKGSDFVMLPTDTAGQKILLDFNYAYNPSCAYNYRWACPLAPQENHLQIRVEAGERRFIPPGDEV